MCVEERFEALHNAGVEAELHILAGVGHGGPEFSNAETAALMTRFLNRTPGQSM